MKTKTFLTITGALAALSLISVTSAFAETQGTENPMAEAQAFLASPTSLTQAIATAKAAAGGKVMNVTLAENVQQDVGQDGENGRDDEQDGENANN